MLCHLAVQRARREYEENGGEDAFAGPDSKQTSPRNAMGFGGLGADYGADMTERMMTLESRLGHLERQRRVRKARSLLQLADWLIRVQTLCVVLTGALLGHYAALVAHVQGWDVEAVAWLQSLLPEYAGKPPLPSPSSFGVDALTAPLLQWLHAFQSSSPAAHAADAYWVTLALGVLALGVFASSTLCQRSVTAFSVVRLSICSYI